MRPVEYRIERIPLDREEPRLLQVVERLAELGRRGWHVASTDLTQRAEPGIGPITVLLEREIDVEDAAGVAAEMDEPEGPEPG
jgi:hypothetical protein